MSTEDNAHQASDAVLRELEGRKGFDWWWDDLDGDIQAEIRDEVAERIREVYR